jgi:hypothetical protein
MNRTREALLLPKVWDWMRGSASDPLRTSLALTERQAIQEERKAPKRQRLANITAQLADHHRQLRNVLDTYAQRRDVMPAGVLNAWLTAETARLQKMRADVEQERAKLERELATIIEYTPEQIADVEDSCAELRTRMQNAAPAKVRATFLDLRISGRITFENGEKVAYCEGMLGENKLQLRSITSIFSW